MSKYTLTLLDTTGIQEYIFDSNRLQENIGASELVYRATTLWAFKALEEAGIKRAEHNVDRPDQLDWDYRPNATIENLQAEVIQAAGGNTLVLFREKDKAIEFVKKLTLRLLKEAPGLTVLAQHKFDFDFDAESLTDARVDLSNKMSKHKLSRIHSAPTFGLSVTAVCSSTGLPAVMTNQEFLLGDDETPSLISREIYGKLNYRDIANDRLELAVGKAALTKDGITYKFPSDMDKLGRISGEESYVAVIHADGNKMREHVISVAQKVQDEFGVDDKKTFNREYINKMRSFSKSLENASRKALAEIVKLIVDAVETDKKGKRAIRGVIPLEKNFIPLRPLVFGGDDVTFLCNGQLGVELAIKYLEAFEKYTADEKLNFHACAGVAIVKMHYPFARAYQLSEELTHSAKKFVKDKVKKDTSAVDWHFAQSGLSGSLDVIRNKEYSITKENSKGEKVKHHLNLRPLVLRNLIQSWQSVENIMSVFQDEKPWSESHNKVVGLREPLRNGAKAVEQYRLNYDLPPLPDVAGDKAAQSGWLGAHCIYFDAIELLDHHVSLKAEAKK